MRVLEHETHMVGAELRQLALGGVLQTRPKSRDRAGGRPIESGHQVEEGGLPDPDRDRHRLTRATPQVDRREAHTTSPPLM